MARTWFGTDGVRGSANTELTPELVLALGTGRRPHHHRHHVPDRPRHPQVRPHAAGRTRCGPGQRGGRCRRRRGPAHAGPGLAGRQAGPARRGHLGVPQSVRRQRDQAVRGGRHQAQRGTGAGHRGRAPPGPRPGAQGTPTARGPRGGDHPHRARPRGPPTWSTWRRHPRRSTTGRAAGGGGQCQRQRIRPGRRVFEQLGAEVVAIGRRARRHQHQLRLRLDGHRAVEPGRGGARGAPRPRPRRRRRPAARRRRDRRAGRRRLAAGPVRPRPGRSRPAGRQHGGGHRDDQSRVPPGHGAAGDPREGDRRRRPPRAVRHRQRGLLARRGTVRSHHLPPAGHDGRRTAHRTRPRGSAGPDRLVAVGAAGRLHRGRSPDPGQRARRRHLAVRRGRGHRHGRRAGAGGHGGHRAGAGAARAAPSRWSG